MTAPSQVNYEVGTPGATPGQSTVAGSVVMVLDGNNVPQAASAATPLPVSIISGGTGGGGSSLSDVLLTDTTGALFIARDTGAAITYASVATGAAYVPVGAVSVADTLAMGTDASAAVQMAGGVGVRGWLSGCATKLTAIAAALAGTLGVSLAGNSVTTPLYIADAALAPVTASWSSATAANTALTVTTAGMDQVIVTINPAAGLTAGAVSFNGFDGVNWINIKAARTDSYLTDGVFTLSGSPGIHAWQVPVAGFPQFEVILSTAIVGAGNVGITAIVSSAPDTSIVTAGLDPLQPLPAGTNLLGAVNLSQINGKAAGYLEGMSSFKYALPTAHFGGQPFTDRASSAITTTGNSGTISDDFGQAIAALINVTAVSGTNPTLDLMLTESYDGGTTYQDIYHAARFTSAGTFTVPNLAMGGKRAWRWVVGGTTPSFTVAITATEGSISPTIARQFFDRALASSQALAAATGAYNVEGCKAITLSANSGSAATACQLQLQLSNDGVNWFAASAALQTVANSVVAVASTGLQGKFARAVVVSTAGVTQTINNVCIYGTN